MTDSAGMRIEAAARRTGFTTRTIRAYQTLGLLAAPRVQGRVGFYDPPHLARLRAIRHLHEQGFSLAGIRALFEAHDRGDTLESILGLEPARAEVDAPAGSVPTPALRLALVPQPLAAALGADPAWPTAS